jgi:hypothetical protein
MSISIRSIKCIADCNSHTGIVDKTDGFIGIVGCIIKITLKAAIDFVI